MVKMANRTKQLRNALNNIPTSSGAREAAKVPVEDAVNRQGHKAYSLSDECKLVTMLNTLKLQPQFYRSETTQMQDLQDVLDKVALKDPYFAAQAIVWSRCLGEGMRSVNHLAATLLLPYISGKEFAKRFYGAFDKKSRSGGGCIYRVDDMSEIKDIVYALGGKSLANSMKKGFASVIEGLDTYQMAKYSKTVVDIANLTHPDSKKSKATLTVERDGKKVEIKTLDALMQGMTVTADTWESAQSEAGQIVSQAVKEGKLSQEEAEKVLSEAKADNWESLLKDGRLGILAALRNIRNIMKNPREGMIRDWCKLITDPVKIKNGLLLPVHFDLAYDVVTTEFRHTDFSPEVQRALIEAYELAIPNLKAALPGKTCVIVDCSGSMGSYQVYEDGRSAGRTGLRTDRTRSAAYKAGLIAATIAKATKADVVKFGGRASMFKYTATENVFSLAKKIGTADLGYTDPASAFQLLTKEGLSYDRIIFISDNEVNGRLVSPSYKEYIRKVCSPYIYGIDLAGYGTACLKSDKVSYLFGYGTQLYEAIASGEFNPEAHLEDIRKIVI